MDTSLYWYYSVGLDRGRCDRTVNSSFVKEGFFVSDGYPEVYRSGVSCTYTFNSQPSERVVIDFVDFDLGGEELRE